MSDQLGDDPDDTQDPKNSDSRDSSGSGEGSDPQDPLAELLRQLGMPGGAQGIDLNAMVQQFNNLFSQMPGAPQPGGPIGFQAPGSFGQGAAQGTEDWSWLKNMVRQMSAAAGPDPSPSSADVRALTDAVRLAEMWLDEAVEFPAMTAPAAVWSRADWIEQTFNSWRPLAEPVIKAVASSLANADEEPADPMHSLTRMMAPMIENLARHMYGAQFARAIADLSQQVVSSSDVGFQLASPRVALIADNVRRHFGELDQSETDVWLYLALREAARQRLFAHAAWLGPQLQALVEHYARETRIDLDALQGSMNLEDLSSLDASSMQQWGEQLQGKLFAPEPTTEQVEIRERLQTLLALVEGWVDHVVGHAAGRWMPAAPALAEAVRRRRVSGGTSDDVLKQLVGLELKPRRVRDAENLWAAVLDARGPAQRDALWAHPDMLPTSSDLDDPLGFADPGKRVEPEADEWDRGLEQLLREEGRGD